MFNDKISDFRRKLHNQLNDPAEQKLLKETRWLLLKNPEKLDPKKNEEKRLEQVFGHCLLFEGRSTTIMESAHKQTAAKFQDNWVQRAKASKIRMLQKFANTLLAHKSGILSYYDFRISTGPLEGINNKNKTMKRQACGFRDKEFLQTQNHGYS